MIILLVMICTLFSSDSIRVLQGGGTPLHWAVEEDSSALVELLIRSGADVNAKDKVSTIHIRIFDTSHAHTVIHILL